MAALADRTAEFHALIVKLSELGLPFKIGEASKTASLRQQLTKFQQHFESQIARGVTDVTTLLQNEPLPINYQRALQLWLSDASPDAAMQCLLTSSQTSKQLRSDYRLAWLWPLCIAIAATVVIAVLLQQLIPQFEQLYIEANQEPGPIFLFFNGISQANLLLYVFIFFLIICLWFLIVYSRRYVSVSRTSQTGDAHAALICGERAAAARANAVGGDREQARLAQLYERIGALFRNRFAKRLQPKILILVGGTFVLVACLVLILPYAEFMWLISAPQGMEP